MSISLSTRTHLLANALFEEPILNNVKKTLVDSVSENIPLCTHTPEGMERIRFSVIKLASENADNLSMAVELAASDWRDLLMTAGFGHGVNEHNNWYERIVS